jgi:hypothetical protein
MLLPSLLIVCFSIEMPLIFVGLSFRIYPHFPFLLLRYENIFQQSKYYKTIMSVTQSSNVTFEIKLQGIVVVLASLKLCFPQD